MSKLRRKRRHRSQADRIAGRVARWTAFALEYDVRLPALSPKGYPPVGWVLCASYQPRIVQARMYGETPLFATMRS